MQHDRYHTYADLTAILRELAADYPALCRLETTGESYEGKSIWLVVVTNFETGPDTDKPALWVDGNIHASELAPSSACLYFLDYLLTRYGDDPDVTRCLDTRTVYVCPRANPDGAELALQTPPKVIRSSTRPWPFDDDPIGELDRQDVDDDGRILSMRIEDPNGAWKVCEQEPRLLVRRDPAESGGTYYRVFPEARIVPEGRAGGFDGVTLRQRPPREGLDLNRNFPAGWKVESEQQGAGPYPTSEPEVRHLVDFIARHPNIVIGISFHTFSGVLLRPFSHRPDDDFAAEDLWTYQKLGKRGRELTGYPDISVFHDFRYHPKKVITGAFDDWLFEHRGAFGWTVEIWSPRAQAGLEVDEHYEWYREHPVDDDIALLRWNDEVLGGDAYVDWYPFEHPDLGPVELGGWDYLFSWRNPPASELEREIARFPVWLVWQLLASPRLEVLRTDVEALGDATWCVRLAIHNTGWLPTYVTKHALDKKLVRGVIAEVELPNGAALRGGRPRRDLGQLEGRAHQTCVPYAWTADDTTDRASVEWIVEAEAGAVIELVAKHERAGTLRVELPLCGEPTASHST